MRLQSIVFSLSEKLNVKELYTEIDSNVLVMDYNQARILPKGILDTGTYFNSLSVRKWKKYTKIDKIKLKGKLSGNFRFEIYERRMIKSIFQEECIYSHEFDFVKEECIDIELDLHHYDSMCFVRIKANSETIVKDLHYFSDYSVDESVNIATVICTFKREAYIERNIEQMGKRLIGNNRSALQNHLDIIVVDNGQTLNLNYKEIKLIKNRNTGGTGGFTRGIIEVLNHQKDKKYTHVLLMDDDVCIEPESIERT